MSSTRKSTTGEFHAERFCSAPEFEADVINGLPASKRIALVKSQAVREILWFLQWRSLSAGGLRQLRDELAGVFPERIGSPTIRKLKNTKREFLESDELRRVRAECDLNNPWSDDALETVPINEWRIEFYRTLARGRFTELPQLLKRFCVDPGADISEGVWFFDDILGALSILRKQFSDAARSRLAKTGVTDTITRTLDFFFARRRMILIEGVAGIGRTVSTRAWADAQCGLVRFVEVPSSSDDRSFFAAIARSLGVARGTSMKAQEIKVRIEEMLLASDLLLAFDESQYLWGQHYRPRKTPDRLLWIKTTFDAGTPVALIAHSDFSKWQSLFVKQTLWTDEQFERRLNRRVVLPSQHSRDDMLKIARAHFPEGDGPCWKYLASYAIGTEKKQASGIVEALESARYRAEQAGRSQVALEDIKAALIHDHAYLVPHETADLQTPGTRIAKAVKSPRNGDSDAPVLPRQRDRFTRSPISLSPIAT